MLKRLDSFSGYALLLVLILLVPAIYGAVNVQSGNSLVHQWLPKGRLERKTYDHFVKHFGDDQFVLATWQGCRLDDPRLKDYCDQLRAHASAEGARLIDSVESSRDFVDRLIDEPTRLSVPAAVDRLSGVLIGNDGTCLVIVRLTAAGIEAQAATLELIFGAADSIAELGRDRLLLAGTIYEAQVVDQAGDRSLKTLVLPSTLCALAVAWICLGRVRDMLLVFILAGLGQLSVIAMLYYSGGKFSAVLIILPTLVFMLSLSTAVHLVNYYRDIAQTNSDFLGTRAMLSGFRPCVLASLTTVMGMGSLQISQLKPVRDFGAYAALGLIVATILLLSMFPRLVSLVTTGGTRRRARDSKPPIAPDSQPHRSAYVSFLEKNAGYISCVGILLLLVSIWGTLSLRASTKFDRMFPRNSPTIRSMNWIEQHIGPMISIEVLLRFRNNSSANQVVRARWVSRVQEALRRLPEVGGVLSASSFLPNLPESAGIRNTIRRAVLNRQLEGHRSDLIEDGWLADDGDSEYWRITAKVSGLQAEDYGYLTAQVRSAAEREISKAPDDANLSIVTTGLSPVIHEAQLMLLSDLGNSFLMAFLLITPVMMLILKGFWAGLLAMVPNVMPVALVFGGMGWLGIRIDIAGILTASIALGIAVDDTLHFLNWFSHARRHGASDSESVTAAFDRCARAMLQTTLISCAAMLPFLFSDFLPTQRFALLMMLMLTGAIIGDLILLPALILSPLGRLLPRNRYSSIFGNASNRNCPSGIR